MYSFDSIDIINIFKYKKNNLFYATIYYIIIYL